MGRLMKPFLALAGVLVTASLIASGCAAPPADMESGTGTITIKGSDTMVILGQRWAEHYMAKQSGVTVQVTGGGSGTGIAALTNGTTDIAQSSRPIKDDEKEAIKERFDKEVVETAVARDGVSLYVHESNPLDSITMEQLRAIYTGQITNWSQVGGPDQPIVLYSRENNSGTYVFFKETVLEDDNFHPRTQNLPGTASVVNAVANDANGIGYGGVAYLTGVKFLKVAKDENSEGFPPEVEYIRSGDYPLARPLFLYTVGEPTGIMKDFIDWTLTDEGQKIVEEVEYIPIT